LENILEILVDQRLLFMTIYLSKPLRIVTTSTHTLCVRAQMAMVLPQQITPHYQALFACKVCQVARAPFFPCAKGGSESLSRWTATMRAVFFAAVATSSRVWRRRSPRTSLAASSTATGPHEQDATPKTSDHACMNCGGDQVMISRRQAAVVGAPLISAATAATAHAERMTEGDNCINCAGDGINPCFRCKGTGQMVPLADRSMRVDCNECGTTGYKLCGRCFGTGLTQTKLTAYRRDKAFKKVLARVTQTRLDESGRKKLKDEIGRAIVTVEQKMAAKA